MDIARQSATHKWMFHFRLSKRTTNSTREAHLYLFINNEFLARETTGGLPGIMRAPGPRSPWDGEAPTHHHPSEGAQYRGFTHGQNARGVFKSEYLSIVYICRANLRADDSGGCHFEN